MDLPSFNVVVARHMPFETFNFICTLLMVEIQRVRIAKGLHKFPHFSCIEDSGMSWELQSGKIQISRETDPFLNAFVEDVSRALMGEVPKT